MDAFSDEGEERSPSPIPGPPPNIRDVNVDVNGYTDDGDSMYTSGESEFDERREGSVEQEGQILDGADAEAEAGAGKKDSIKSNKDEEQDGKQEFQVDPSIYSQCSSSTSDSDSSSEDDSKEGIYPSLKDLPSPFNPLVLPSRTYVSPSISTSPLPRPPQRRLNKLLFSSSSPESFRTASSSIPGSPGSNPKKPIWPPRRGKSALSRVQGQITPNSTESRKQPLNLRTLFNQERLPSSSPRLSPSPRPASDRVHSTTKTTRLPAEELDGRVPFSPNPSSQRKISNPPSLQPSSSPLSGPSHTSRHRQSPSVAAAGSIRNSPTTSAGKRAIDSCHSHSSKLEREHEASTSPSSRSHIHTHTDSYTRSSPSPTLPLRQTYSDRHSKRRKLFGGPSADNREVSKKEMKMKVEDVDVGMNGNGVYGEMDVDDNSRSNEHGRTPYAFAGAPPSRRRYSNPSPDSYTTRQPSALMPTGYSDPNRTDFFSSGSEGDDDEENPFLVSVDRKGKGKARANGRKSMPLLGAHPQHHEHYPRFKLGSPMPTTTHNSAKRRASMPSFAYPKTPSSPPPHPASSSGFNTNYTARLGEIALLHGLSKTYGVSPGVVEAMWADVGDDSERGVGVLVGALEVLGRGKGKHKSSGGGSGLGSRGGAIGIGTSSSDKGTGTGTGERRVVTLPSGLTITKTTPPSPLHPPALLQIPTSRRASTPLLPSSSSSPIRRTPQHTPTARDLSRFQGPTEGLRLVPMVQFAPEARKQRVSLPMTNGSGSGGKGKELRFLSRGSSPRTTPAGRGSGSGEYTPPPTSRAGKLVSLASSQSHGWKGSGGGRS